MTVNELIDHLTRLVNGKDAGELQIIWKTPTECGDYYDTHYLANVEIYAGVVVLND